MARRANKKDTNQAEIERRLKRIGVQIIDVSMLKDDTLDMLALWRGLVHLVEVKNPDYLPKYFFRLDEAEQRTHLEGLLTDNEKRTMNKCKLAGVKFIITYSADHCLKEMGGLPKPFSNK